MLTKNKILAEILDKNLEDLAQAEQLSSQEIRQGIEKGSMVALINPHHSNVVPTLIGQPARIKVNANIGTSPFINDLNLELKKVQVAKCAGAHTIMDLSTAGDLDEIRRLIIEHSPLPVGTVPIYSVAQKYIGQGQDPSKMSVQEIFEEIHKQAEQGVDFMTVHCGVTRRAASLVEKGQRVMGIVSRGGSILAKWMQVNEKENPLYEYYDDLLKLAKEFNLTLSLGDGMRPGAGIDAGDAPQWEEVVILSELTLRAWEQGVQVMIEGPGHVPLHLVESQIRGIKQLCHNAPLYVLGPLTTDIAPGYDHIAGAIGGALAAINGADFLCYLTPAEHLTLPDLNDVYQGVIASLIAAHSAEVAMGRKDAVERNNEISRARKELDWERITSLALDPGAVKRRREEFAGKEECAMCGEFCAVKMLR